MTESDTVQSHVPDQQRARVSAVVTVLAIPVGLGLSIFGFFGWCVGPLVLAVGFVGQRLDQRWAHWAIRIGGGLLLGALLYIAIGLLTPDGASSGSGTGTPQN